MVVWLAVFSVHMLFAQPSNYVPNTPMPSLTNWSEINTYGKASELQTPVPQNYRRTRKHVTARASIDWQITRSSKNTRVSTWKDTWGWNGVTQEWNRYYDHYNKAYVAPQYTASHSGYTMHIASFHMVSGNTMAAAPAMLTVVEQSTPAELLPDVGVGTTELGVDLHIGELLPIGDGIWVLLLMIMAWTVARTCRLRGESREGES